MMIYNKKNIPCIYLVFIHSSWLTAPQTLGEYLWVDSAGLSLIAGCPDGVLRIGGGGGENCPPPSPIVIGCRIFNNISNNRKEEESLNKEEGSKLMEIFWGPTHC